jgi:glycosyltransferase involved in cell wall biosynthesis
LTGSVPNSPGIESIINISTALDKQTPCVQRFSKECCGERMKVLLSAYACEPNKGSEQEIGWQRVLHMPPYADEVWVITRANNQEVIEADPQSHAPGLNFIYYDLPAWLIKLKKNLSWFLSTYIFLWQWGAYRVAARHHRTKRFDMVYHVTFTGMISGSFMSKLGIPLVVGPIAGGERAPFPIRRNMPFRFRLIEFIRDIGIAVQRYSPIICPALAAAERIYVTTPESLSLVQSRWHHKTQVQLSVGSCAQTAGPSQERPAPPPRFIFAGRLLHWKGIHFAIRALADARATVPDAKLTIVGKGPAEAWLRAVAKKSGVSDAVDFAGHVPRPQLIDSLAGYKAMVFPSLHDSGGLVVLEAFWNGLPVICLDLGGPGVMVNATSGVVVPTTNADDSQAVKGIAQAMVSLARMTPGEYTELSAGAVARANELSWAALTARVVRGSS